MKGAVLGVAIGPTIVHAALVVQGRCVWEEMRQRTSVTAALSELFASAPAGKRRASHLVVALTHPDVQLKKLHDLPATTDVALLTAAVAQHLPRFFIRGQRPLRPSVVVPAGPQAAWSAAYDEAILVEIASVAGDAGLPLRAVLPLPWAIAAALPDGTVLLDSGEAVQQVVIESGSLVTVSLTAGNTSAVADWTELLRLAALGAATLDLRTAPAALGIGVGAAGGSIGRVRKWALPVLSLAASTGLVAVLPLLLAMHATSVARSRIREIAPQRPAAIALAASATLASYNRTALARLVSSVSSRTLLLAALASALPDSAAITRLQVDSSSVDLTLIATQLGAAVDALARTPGVHGVELVNGVSRATSAGGLEQGIVRFRLGPSPALPTGAGVPVTAAVAP